MYANFQINPMKFLESVTDGRMEKVNYRGASLLKMRCHMNILPSTIGAAIGRAWGLDSIGVSVYSFRAPDVFWKVPKGFVLMSPMTKISGDALALKRP